MILFNKTQQKIISKNHKISATFLQNLFGLIRNNEPISMQFSTSFGIHTFIMKHKIDILILDKSSKVVKIKKDLEPNKLYFWNPLFSRIIELMLLKNHNTKVGDILEIRK